MPNNIAFRKAYTTILDEVYKLASLTSVLDGPNDMVREGANANEILIPKMDMDGLGDYDRQKGYPDGSVTLEYETKKCSYDRGKKFMVDAVDNMDTAGVAFGRLAGEFLRTKVVPELDAYRFASYASTEGIKSAYGALANGKDVLTALRVARSAILEVEATLEGSYLFITPTLRGVVDDLDTTASKKAMEGFAGVISVPQTRFVSSVKLGENGFTKGEQAVDINFMIIPKAAVIQFQKHTVPKIFSPDENQGGDGYMFAYRTVGIAETYDNKRPAMYVHTASEITG